MFPLMIAHRGDTVNFPENTLEAFQSAFDKGADGIELDVQVNVEGKVFVAHDYLYKPNRNYLLLETVLQKFSQRGLIEIEIKSFEAEIVKKITTLIKKFSPLKYELTSSVLPILPYIHQELPEANIGAILKPYLIEAWMTPDLIQRLLIGYMHLTKANVAHLYPQQFDQSLITVLKKQGFKVHGHIYTDKIEEYEKIVTLGFNKCTFDKINLLEEIKKV